MGPMIPKEMKYNLHYGKVRGDVLPQLQCSKKKRQKDFLWKQKTHYILENGSLGFIETLHKQ